MPDWMTVEAFLSYWRPFYPRWNREFEQRIVKKFALPPKRKIKHLSRGMKMKVAVTSALAFRPRLMVLDEPLSGLDPLVRDDLMETLVELAGETTVLFSSHDLAEIESFASHVGYLDSGKLVLSQNKAEVRKKYRRVVATGAEPLRIPEQLPKEWHEFAAEGSSARWIEIAFDQESEARARTVLGPAELSTSPLTLREVFLTHARASEHAEPKGGRK
jgi:ABC-2 type transport system ATP-binding protein